MNRLSQGAVAIAACAAMFASICASAQGRAAPARKPPVEAPVDDDKVLDPAARARKLAELDGWLRRLVGHYRVNGNVDQALNYNQLRKSSKIRGMADCNAIGAGPGVRCMIDATWQPIRLISDPGYGGNSDFTYANIFTLHPVIFLFGLDSVAPEIRVLEVDDHSIAVDGNGIRMDADTLEYSTSCPAIGGGVGCRRVRATAKARSDVVSIEIMVTEGTHFNLLLRRTLADESGDTPKSR
jgi:hypothetical protein